MFFCLDEWVDDFEPEGTPSHVSREKETIVYNYLNLQSVEESLTNTSLQSINNLVESSLENDTDSRIQDTENDVVDFVENTTLNSDSNRMQDSENDTVTIVPDVIQKITLRRTEDTERDELNLVGNIRPNYPSTKSLSKDRDMASYLANYLRDRFREAGVDVTPLEDIVSSDQNLYDNSIFEYEIDPLLDNSTEWMDSLDDSVSSSGGNEITDDPINDTKVTIP